MECKPCAPGGYCVAGAANTAPCPAGYFNADEGASNVTDCKECSPGMSGLELGPGVGWGVGLHGRLLRHLVSSNSNPYPNPDTNTHPNPSLKSSPNPSLTTTNQTTTKLTRPFVSSRDGRSSPVCPRYGAPLTLTLADPDPHPNPNPNPNQVPAPTRASPPLRSAASASSAKRA